MIPPQILGILYALASAAAWGSGDFTGGVAARSQDQFRVLYLMTIPGIIVLALIAYAFGEPLLPSVRDILWAASAGLCGAFGIATLYRGLSLGNMAIVAPTAAVIGAGLPVLFSSITMGLPDVKKLAGFLLAGIGIWLVSRPPNGHDRLSVRGLNYAFIAGTCFGGYFIFVAQVDAGLVFSPLIYAKTASLMLAIIIILFRHERLPGLRGSATAVLAGVFDAGGNAFYMLARQFTRLDTAAVLASMYPAVTVVLAGLILKEKVLVSQWHGLAVCLAAIALISS